MESTPTIADLLERNKCVSPTFTSIETEILTIVQNSGRELQAIAVSYRTWLREKSIFNQ